MAVSQKIDTKPWDTFVRTVKEIGSRKIAVGVFGDGDLATIAATHEYGEEEWHATGKGVPERSYIRSTLREQQAQLGRQLKRVAAAYTRGKLDAVQALGIVGEWAANAIKKKIRSNIPPPLKPATVARKGSTKALIDTGRLLNSVTWKVVD